jgi:hypothetical protein
LGQSIEALFVQELRLHHKLLLLEALLPLDLLLGHHLGVVDGHGLLVVHLWVYFENLVAGLFHWLQRLGVHPELLEDLLLVGLFFRHDLHDTIRLLNYWVGAGQLPIFEIETSRLIHYQVVSNHILDGAHLFLGLALSMRLLRV